MPLKPLGHFVARFAAATIGAGALALLDGALAEPAMLWTRTVPVPVNPRFRQLVGLRLAHLSDLHVGGKNWHRGTIARAIDACNQTEVDLVAITGDFIGRGRGIKPMLELLSSLRTDVPRVAVLGNHDHVYGRLSQDSLVKGLSALGIQLLRNDLVSVDLPGGPLWIAGVDDGYSMRDDLDRVRRLLPEDCSPRLFLTHYPEVAERLAPGEFQLSLAGHSHGGQVRLPIIANRVLRGHARTRYARGLYRVNGNPLHVSPGLGMSGIPLRFLNPPQVTVIEFRLDEG